MANLRSVLLIVRGLRKVHGEVVAHSSLLTTCRSCHCRCMRAPCATHVQHTRTNPSVHVKRGYIRVNRGSTQPGDEKRRPRRPRFEHKHGLGVHKRRPRGTRRAWSDVPGNASLGVPRVRPCRRAESSPGPMCTPVEARPHADSAHFTTHLSRRCRCTNKP